MTTQRLAGSATRAHTDPIFILMPGTRARELPAPTRYIDMTVSKAVVVATDPPRGSFATSGFRPAALMPLANKPVISYALERLRDSGIRAAAIVVGRSSRTDVEALVGDGRTWGLETSYIDEPESDLASTLRAAEPFLDGEPFLVQHGDALVDVRIGLLGHRFTDEDFDALAIRLSGVRPRPSHAEGPASLAPVGACFLSGRAVRTLHARVPGTGVGLADLLAFVREGGGRVGVERVDGSLPCRGGRDVLLAANRWALEQIRGGDQKFEDSQIQGPVDIHPTAVLQQATLRGPIVVGPRARIVHSFVGPYTSVGADVTVEGAEVEHSILLDGSQVRFPGVRLEGSILGRDARVGRDYSLPHALRLLVADGAEISLA
jgi:glucose-1-phosphate thymidylyltransferase